MTENVTHKAVLLNKVLEFLDIKKGKRYIDTTVGGGGHAEAILKLGGEVLGIDLDPVSLRTAEKHLIFACPADVCRYHLHHGNFSDLEEIAQKYGFIPAAGILFDLGISSFQLEDSARGFSFGSEILDMRINPKDQKVTAGDLVNGLTEKELYELFSKLAEEHHPWPLIRAIVGARRIKRIETARELVQIIADVPQKTHPGRHPATNIFRALRMAVNDELNNLKVALPQAIRVLDKGGRMIVISFHSLEDRIVKNFFKEQEKESQVGILTKKPIVTTPEETFENPRSRSAKLRVAEKL